MRINVKRRQDKTRKRKVSEVGMRGRSCRRNLELWEGGGRGAGRRGKGMKGGGGEEGEERGRGGKDVLSSSFLSFFYFIFFSYFIIIHFFLSVTTIFISNVNRNIVFYRYH